MQRMLIVLLTLTLLGCASNPPQQSVSSKPKVNNVQAAEYNTQLGIGYLHQNNYERAKEKLLLALKQNPASPQANSAMAYFLEKTADYQNAETYYKKAISLAKDSGPMQNNYGAFLCRRGQYLEANQQFVQAAQDPKYLNPANAYENAGLCAMLIPDHDAAINYFKEALQKNPKMGTSIFQLAELYYQQQNYPQSYQYVQQYLKEKQPNAEVLWLAIRLAYQRGDYNSAASYGILLQSKFSETKQYQEYLKLKATKG